VSKKHATVTYHGLNPPTITNHSQRNGLWVNDTFVPTGASVDLKGDDVIRIAGATSDTALYTFTVKLSTPPADTRVLHVIVGTTVQTCVNFMLSVFFFVLLVFFSSLFCVIRAVVVERIETCA
jgi:hypothetical protein